MYIPYNVYNKIHLIKKAKLFMVLYIVETEASPPKKLRNV